MRTRLCWLVVSLGVIGFSGCFCCGKRSCCPPAPYVPGCSCNPQPNPGLVPIGRPGPGPVVVPPPPAPADTAAIPPPAPPPTDVRPYEPSGTEQGTYYWRPAEENGVRHEIPADTGVDHGVPGENGVRYAPPAENGVRLGSPLPDSAGPAKPPVSPLPRLPRETEPPAVREDRQLPRGPDKPIVREEREQTPSLPVGIPQFTLARDQVATGLKPTIDGLDWLKDNKYLTVLHIRAPGEDDSADKKQLSKRGINYLSLEVSATALPATAVKEFARIVSDKKGYPLFVYDKDGMVAGGLWYLYFRSVENDSEETARLKAGRLGLKEDQDGDHKAMWLAIQKYLSQQNGK